MSRHRRQVYFTLDILTDGSEHTGHGTLFLSAWKPPPRPSSNDKNHSGQNAPTAIPTDGAIKEATLLARYAISGVGDALARLCADQRFKLAATRALFLPSDGGACIDGLSTLLLALHGAGSPSLHVVLPPSALQGLLFDTGHKEDDKSMGDIIEELATISLGAHKHFDIRTCQIPKPDEKISSDNTTGTLHCPWWKVYEDEFLEVHASWYKEVAVSNTEKACDADFCESLKQPLSWSLLFLYSFPKMESASRTVEETEPTYTTMAVFPPKCNSLLSACKERLTRESTLPLLRGSVPISSIDFVVALDPNSVHDLADVTQNHSTTTFLTTVPQHKQVDNGILIRSQQLARYFHHHMPWAFAAPPKTSTEYVVPMASRNNAEAVGSKQPFNNFAVLASGTSMILLKPDGLQSTELTILDRRKDIWDMDLKEEWTSTLESLQSFIPAPLSKRDENEIDLDENESDDGSFESNVYGAENYASLATTPRLLVLGTGCATPSAYRGASGYALILPGHLDSAQDEQIFVLDCGEAFVTMLSRQWDDNQGWKRRIKGIWISHAHLDHYGGLPCLLRVLYNERKRTSVNNWQETRGGKPPSKRPRQEDTFTESTAPWVMAPVKVLRYLDIMLHCRHGYRLNYNSDEPKTLQHFFLPRVHDYPTLAPPGPWSHFENIKVHHNCCPAYGLLVGWKNKPVSATPHHNPHQFLCYSGDTRPCHGLVDTCRDALRKSHTTTTMNDSILTLIHEATFEEIDIENARKKKHSTIGEALQVASNIPATKVLLTHFSQRYISLQNLAPTHGPKSGLANIPMGLAADGLWVPLA